MAESKPDSKVKRKIERVLAPAGAVALVRTPLGYVLKRLRVKSDGIYLDGKPLVGARPDNSFIIIRRGLLRTRSYVAWLVDPATNTVLPPPKDGAAMDPDTARANAILGSIVTNIALSRRKEQLLLGAIVVIVIAAFGAIAAMSYFNSQSITEIASAVHRVLEYINSTQLPPPPG